MKERKRFEIIRKVSEILNKYNIFANVFFTIVDIRLPKKGGIMKIYLSVFPQQKSREVVDFFNKMQKEIKNEIKENIYLRHLPSQLRFFSSSAFEEADRVFRLLEKIKNEEKNQQKK